MSSIASRQSVPVGARVGVSAAAFPAHRRSVRDARRFAASVLSRCDRCDDAVLCCSELATNAVEHAGAGPFRVAALTGRGWAYLAVIDAGGGESAPHVTDAGTASGSGRGLALVSLLASAWNAVPVRDGGWRVWCEFEDGR